MVQRPPRPADAIGMDPFALTCDPRRYVARPACDAVLARLEAAASVRRTCALAGPPGIGKTQLLRVLEARLAGRARSVWVPYGALEPNDFFRLVLGLMERSTSCEADPEQALAELATRGAAQGLPLLLVLDDAHAIPLPTVQRLVSLAARLSGAFCLLAAVADDARAARVLAALGREVEHVRFASAMSEDETARYVAARLAQAGAPPDALARLGPDIVRWLHRESAGVPRRVHQLAGWMLHRDDPVPDTAPPLAHGGPALELDRS
jgi:type II secretory pathway predicted ATPase ExeA